MKYISVKELSRRWNISERRIRALLASGKITGAFQIGSTWNIPDNVIKPEDGRLSIDKSDAKTVIVAGINSEIGKSLIEILSENDYEIIGLYQKGEELKIPERENLTLYAIDYESTEELINFTKNVSSNNIAGFVFSEIFFNLEDSENFDYALFEKSFKINVFALNIFVRELVKKMNYESSIVVVSSIEAYRGSFGASAYASAQAAKVSLVQTWANTLSEMYGVRINTLAAGWIGSFGFDEAFNVAKEVIPMKRLGMPYEIADDIFIMLTRHKYSTGSTLVSDGGYLSVDMQSKTEDLNSGKYYRWIFDAFEKLKAGEHVWAVSTMMPNEWSETPEEKKFRALTLETISKGVKSERIFIFDFNNTKELFANKELRDYCVRHDAFAIDKKVAEKVCPNAIKTIGYGILCFNSDKVFVDYLCDENSSRGYMTFNKKQIQDYYEAFLELKKHAVKISEVVENCKKNT